MQEECLERKNVEKEEEEEKEKKEWGFEQCVRKRKSQMNKRSGFARSA